MASQTTVVLIVLATISGSFSLHPIWDFKFQDEWKGACATGLFQTPIAIPAICERNLTKFMTLEFTNMQLPINKFVVTNSGRQTTFEWERGAGNPQRYITVRTSQNVAPFHKDTRYVLQNIHVHHNLNPHTGTNHAIGGSKYAMEMHMIFLLPKYDNNYLGAFEAGPGNAIEIAILWRLSNVKHATWSIFNDLMLSQKLSENQTITSGETSFRVSDFIPKNSDFVLYPGSLILNNCFEVATWIVFDQPMDFDTADLGMRHWTYISGGVEKPMHRNIRHIQSRSGRPVYHGRIQKIKYDDAICL